MAEKINITFLGTSDAIPSIRRNHTSILLTFKDENILIDCGEGTQRQFKKAKINLLKITKLLITHWHGDHVLGIPGLLQTLAFNNYQKTLFIYGPEGTKKLIKQMLKTFVFSGEIKLKITEIKQQGVFFENQEISLSSKKVYHGIPCNAYSFTRKGQIKIDKNKLKKSKLSQGPFLKKLKQGKDITYKGKKYKAKNLTFQEPDKKITFILDTGFNNSLIDFAKNSELLITDSSFSEKDKELSQASKHLTAKQAAEIAKKAKAKKLILTHISQRYSTNLKEILNEAKKVFKNTSIAKDFDKIVIE